MKTIRNNYKSIIICTFLIGLIVIVGLMIKPAHANQAQQAHWLEQFERRVVEVTFIVPPPGKSQVVRVQLVQVLSNGIIVKYDSPNDIFYTFSSILSIDP